MSDTTQADITWILGTLLATFAIISLAVRFILLPWLREHLVTPMKQVEKQVSVNEHSSLKPTVLDRLDDVQTAVDALGTDLAELRAAFNAHLDNWQEHLDWSTRTAHLQEREIALIRHELAAND